MLAPCRAERFPTKVCLAKHEADRSPEREVGKRGWPGERAGTASYAPISRGRRHLARAGLPASGAVGRTFPRSGPCGLHSGCFAPEGGWGRRRLAGATESSRQRQKRNLDKPCRLVPGPESRPATSGPLAGCPSRGTSPGGGMPTGARYGGASAVDSHHLPSRRARPRGVRNSGVSQPLGSAAAGPDAEAALALVASTTSRRRNTRVVGDGTEAALRRQ